MHGQLVKIFVAVAGVILIAGSVLLYFAAIGALPDISGQKTNTSVADNPQAVIQAPVSPTIGLFLQGKRSILLFWDNIRTDIVQIAIYRSKNKTEWTQWKVVTLPNTSGRGTFSITLPAGTDAQGYTYYFEAINSSSVVVFTTGTTTVQTATSTQLPPFVLASSTPTSTPPTNQPPATPPTPTASSTTTSTPTTTPTTTATSSTPTPTSTPQYPYYTPNGQPSGQNAAAAAFAAKNFYVLHADQGIEVGWRNLPSDTMLIIVYRSSSASGSWTELLRHQYNKTSPSGFLRIIDDSLNQPLYYKMEAKNTSGATLATYGPEFLDKK